MPPKSKITREMILEAAYAIAREQGADQINARSISQRLGYSTQPVLYHFATMEEIRKEVYQMADAAHGAALMQILEGINPMIAIGLNYIRFAYEEKHLFRMLFQSNSFSGQNLAQMLDAPEILPMLEIFQKEAELSMEQVKFVFKALNMLVHGYASLLANNNMEYNEEEVIPMLEVSFMGMIGAFKMEATENEETV